MAQDIDKVDMMFRGSDVKFGINHKEIEGLPPLGDFILCSMCGTRHIIRYGKEKMEDGTMVESRKLSFITCNEKDYIVGINGKDVRHSEPKEEIE